MHLFFDLDGTLTDPKLGITRCIQYALECLGRPVPQADELEWCIGPPLAESFEVILGDAALATEALGLYRERFADRGMFENAVYDGVGSLLDRLSREERSIYLATSKPKIYADRILEHFGLDRYFAATFGAELDGTRANKSDLLRYALSTTGAPNAHSIMIGDRHHDIDGARANEMRSIGVLYGYGSEKELKDAGANAVAGTPHDLYATIAQFEPPLI